MRTIGLITYDKPHKKTYDLACLLKASGATVVFLTAPFEERSERHPLVQHRPEGIKRDPSSIASAFGWGIAKYGEVKCDILLIGGCNITPGLRALNSHPGYLPYIRGLDALKWAIWHEVPVGVSVHWTTDKPDAGRIVSRKIVPLYFEDTFHSFALRAYNIEIEELVKAALSDETTELTEDDSAEMRYLRNTVHKRMAPWQEVIMLEKFNGIRSKAKSIYSK